MRVLDKAPIYSSLIFRLQGLSHILAIQVSGFQLHFYFFIHLEYIPFGVLGGDQQLLLHDERVFIIPPTEPEEAHKLSFLLVLVQLVY